MQFLLQNLEFDRSDRLNKDLAVITDDQNLPVQNVKSQIAK